MRLFEEEVFCPSICSRRCFYSKIMRKFRFLGVEYHTYEDIIPVAMEIQIDEIFWLKWIC